jgi:hypothetical protein
MKIINSKISRCGLHNIYYIYDNYAELRFCNSEDVFIIDIESIEKMIDYQWYVKKSDWGYYSTGYVNKKVVILSRFLLNAQIGQYVDHINKNTLDNRIENLRFVTNQQNGFNRKVGKNNTSGIMGVEWSKQKNKWQAKIKFNYKTRHLGFFDDINDATIARLNGEKEYFGEFAPQRYLFEQYGV